MTRAITRTERELRRIRIVKLLDTPMGISAAAEVTGFSQRYVRAVALQIEGQRAACTHDWDGGTLIRRCLRCYVCRTCGARQTIDSGD